MNYYEEIKNIIEEREVNRIVREIKDNRDDLLSRWNIGKLLVDAQGGLSRAKYGSSLIKEWGKEFESHYGKSYDYTNLSRMIKFYKIFPKVATLSQYLSWSHITDILPLKNENERIYYINQVILNNLSVRELRSEIKNKAYDRLSYVDKNNIKLIEDNNYSLTIEDMIKDPILIKVEKDITKLSEKALHKYIIDMLESKFLELGVGFTLAGHEYKIIIDNRTYKIDLLFFNTKLNRYIVIEVKVREVKPEDIGQVDFYVNYIDKHLKEKYMNKTIGLLIVRKNNKLVLEYTTNKDIFVTTYKLMEKETR